ncbi:MAG: 6-phosphogluconolactonase [Terriglobales bacterium]
MTNPQPEIRIVNTQADLFQAAAQEFVAQVNQAISARGKFSVALSGGSTPKGLFTLLASGSIPNIPWDKIFFFWSDERHVPPDDPESNYRMANEAMLSKVPVPAANVFRVRAEEKDADIAANEYEQTISKFFGLRPGEFPRFDLIFLGIGPDGHTASLFPGSSGLEEKSRLVIANWVEKFNTFRITFTYPVLNHSACVMFLASGPDKAAILHEVLEDPASNLPCQRVRPGDGSLIWLLDRAAASGLSRSGLKTP